MNIAFQQRFDWGEEREIEEPLWLEALVQNPGHVHK